jgi:osmotically-inducible protein OsmY
MKNKNENIKLSERHYTSAELENIGRKIIKRNISKNESYKEKPDNVQSDSRIRQNVLEALYRSTLLDSSNIDAEVMDGKVSLRGSVKTLAEKKFASEVIQYIPGIVEVFNDLIIRNEMFSQNIFHA